MKRILLFLACLFTAHSELQSSQKTLLITGACGFIGSNFLDHMYTKYPDYSFIVLDALTYAGRIENIPQEIQKSPRFTFVHDNILNRSVVEQIMTKVDYVVHFAAESHVTRSIEEDLVFFETDLLGTRILLQALIKSPQVERFIHISTSEVYGTAEYEPMDELHPINPRSPYAAAKSAADRLVYAYNCTFDLPTLIIRPFNNYGPRQHVEKMIPCFVKAASEASPLSIHGDGSQKRDWLYVEDTCRAIDMALHVEPFCKIKQQELNVGSGIATSVLDIAKVLLNKFDLPSDHYVLTKDRPGQVECHIANNKKAKRLLGWSPQVSLEEGLEKTVDWYLAHPKYIENF